MRVIRNKHFSVHDLRFSGLQLALASSGLMLLLVGLFMVPNFIPDSTHADDFPPPISDPSISIAPAGGINLVMTPNVGSGGSFGTAIANVTVNTSNTTGYTFTMNTETTNTDLINNKIDYTQSGMSDFKITNLTATTTTSNFPLNKWGYNVHKSGTYIKGAANTFIPVPNSGSSDADRQIEITSTNGSNTYSFAYGVKADVNMPAGDYSTTIVFSATANPLPTMQDFDYTACAALSTGDTVSLYDERDNEEYLIGKLADGNCWMLDNMRLDLTNSTVLNSLTTDNTNVDSASLTSLKSGNRAADNRYASSGFATWSSSNTSNQYNQAKANADYKNTTTTSYGAGSGKIGVYYNFCAASAGNYCYDQYAAVDDPNTLQDAQYDICPKGWRMPTSTTDGEYQALLTAYNDNKTATNSGSFQYNLSTPHSGTFYSGSASTQSGGGWFWSSTWRVASYIYYLYASASGVAPSGTNNPRDYGFSVRCMVKPGIINGMYMQDVTQKNIQNTPTDVTYTLKDSRDEKEYTVAKLQDGNLWMTQNLALGGSTAMNLTQANSNVGPNGFTLPASVTEGSWASSTTTPEFFDYAGTHASDQATTKYGNFYNWPAATAGSGGNSGDAQYSICPKNWRLPSAGTAATTNNEFYTMLNNYITTGTWGGTSWSGVTTTNFTNAPVSLVFSGGYSGVLDGQGRNGIWWSSTAYASSHAYVLRVGSSNASVYPHSNSSRNVGDSVRCLMPGA